MYHCLEILIQNVRNVPQRLTNGSVRYAFGQILNSSAAPFLVGGNLISHCVDVACLEQVFIGGLKLIKHPLFRKEVK